MRLSVGAKSSLAAAMAASLMLVTFLVVTTSRAAFTGTTSNAGSSVSAGAVALVDDDSGAVLFSVTGVVPGWSASNCIKVTYTGTGTVPTQAVKLYRSGAVGGTGLDQYLDLTVEMGTGGSFGTCTGFSSSATVYSGTLQSFMTNKTDWASGDSTSWTPNATNDNRVFRFTLSLQDNDLAQGKDATFGFTWESRS